MMNPFADVNWNPDLRARRKFAVSLVIGFPVIAVLLSLAAYLKTHHVAHFPIWLGATGLAVGVVLWLIPQIAKPFYVVWYFLGCCVGIVVGNVVFALFYFLVFTPFGLFRRLLNRKSFPKGFDKSAATYWQPAEKVVDLKRYYRQF